MPVGERTGRRVTWNHFLFLPVLLNPGCRLRFSPRVAFLAGAEAREIAAARGTAVRRRADSQKEPGPQRRIIVLLTPGGQILAIAARAAGVSPRTAGPTAGFPARLASAAAQLINPDQSLQMF